MKIACVILGSMALALGIVGIFVPVLPTTPFLLLAAALYARSSPNLHRRLLDNKYLGSYIRNFQEHRALPLRVKIISVSLLWGAMFYSVFFAVEAHEWAQVLLIVIATAVSLHILSFDTLKK